LLCQAGLLRKGLRLLCEAGLLCEALCGSDLLCEALCGSDLLRPAGLLRDLLQAVRSVQWAEGPVRLPSLRELRLRRSEGLCARTHMLCEAGLLREGLRLLCETGLLCEALCGSGVLCEAGLLREGLWLLCEADLLCEALCGSRMLCETGLLRDLREALLLLPNSPDSYRVEGDQWLVRLQEVQLLHFLCLAGPRGLRSVRRLR
jgi:hypothetical protein